MPPQGDMKTCRILNGMWQLSGAHGFRPDEKPALKVENACFAALLVYLGNTRGHWEHFENVPVLFYFYKY